MAGTERPLNVIDATEVNAALRGTRLGGGVVHLPEVDSTNDLALRAAQAGTRSGVWVADAQTAGRGRGGHTWHSAPGDGLYMSALFTPQLPASAVNLSLVTGLAVWEAIREVTGLTVDIRWPNDLVTRPETGVRSCRKLGGILAETAAAPPLPAQPHRPAMLRYAVIGVGINVAHRAFPHELGGVASSLFLEGWGEPDRQALLIALLKKMDGYIRRLEDDFAGVEAGVGSGSGLRPGSGPDPGVLARLEEASTWLRGKRVQVPEDGGYTGTTAGLDPSGFLLVDGDDGVRHTVRSGGVRER